VIKCYQLHFNTLSTVIIKLTGNENFDSIAHYFRGEIWVSIAAAGPDVEASATNFFDPVIANQLFAAISSGNCSSRRNWFLIEGEKNFFLVCIKLTVSDWPIKIMNIPRFSKASREAWTSTTGKKSRSQKLKLKNGRKREKNVNLLLG
jgi:hypothetical protein